MKPISKLFERTEKKFKKNIAEKLYKSYRKTILRRNKLWFSIHSRHLFTQTIIIGFYMNALTHFCHQLQLQFSTQWWSRVTSEWRDAKWRRDVTTWWRGALPRECDACGQVSSIKRVTCEIWTEMMKNGSGIPSPIPSVVITPSTTNFHLLNEAHWWRKQK